MYIQGRVTRVIKVIRVRSLTIVIRASIRRKRKKAEWLHLRRDLYPRTAAKNTQERIQKIVLTKLRANLNLRQQGKKQHNLRLPLSAKLNTQSKLKMALTSAESFTTELTKSGLTTLAMSPREYSPTPMTLDIKSQMDSLRLSKSSLELPSKRDLKITLSSLLITSNNWMRTERNMSD